MVTERESDMNSEKPRIIVLGGTDSHCILLEHLKERGFYTILVDYLDSPLAKDYADLHLQISTFDKEEVLKAAEEFKVSAIMTASVDQVNTTACYVAEKLGLPRPYNYATAERIIDKSEMKRAMVSRGIPTTKYVYLEIDDPIENIDLTFPVVTKPVDNHGASGVKVSRNVKELEQYLKEARSFSRSGRTVVEEFFSGVEVSAYTVVKDGKANIIMISARQSVCEGADQVMKCYATVTPTGISETAVKKIQKAADGIAEEFGLLNTPLHVQAIVDGDDISVIEFAARVAGGLSTDIIRKHIGLDLIDVAIDSWLGNEMDIYTKPLDKYYAVNLIYGKDGIYDHIEGIDDYIDNGAIEEFHCFRKKGAKISGEKANSCRVAAFVTEGETREDLHNKAEEIFSKISVVGTDGSDLIRRDLIIT